MFNKITNKITDIRDKIDDYILYSIDSQYIFLIYLFIIIRLYILFIYPVYFLY